MTKITKCWSIQRKMYEADITFSVSVIYLSLNTQGLDQNTIGLGIIILTLACPFSPEIETFF